MSLLYADWSVMTITAYKYCNIVQLQLRNTCRFRQYCTFLFHTHTSVAMTTTKHTLITFINGRCCDYEKLSTALAIRGWIVGYHCLKSFSITNLRWWWWWWWWWWCWWWWHLTVETHKKVHLYSNPFNIMYQMCMYKTRTCIRCACIKRGHVNKL